MLHKDFRIILNLKTPPTASCSMVKGRTFLLMKILRGIFEESLVNFKREKYILYDNRDFFKHLFCPLALRDAVLTQNGSFFTVKSDIFIKSGCGLLNLKIRNNVDISKVPTELML